MSAEPDSNRRTALKALGALCLGGLTVPAVSAEPGADVERDADRSRNDRLDRGARATDAATEASDAELDPSRTGAYVGVVDRIVDGEHVVILLEDGDRVVDQAVVPHEEWPFLEEGSLVRVVLVDGTVLAIRLLEDRPGEAAG